ncbi:hypothetical protein [Haliangium sp.]|uniref:hypothetical protein n=1 Tax=Haliangium sp. TaxID=2663208 RepID=UPI003D137902
MRTRPLPSLLCRILLTALGLTLTAGISFGDDTSVALESVNVEADTWMEAQDGVNECVAPEALEQVQDEVLPDAAAGQCPYGAPRCWQDSQCENYCGSAIFGVCENNCCLCLG